MTDKYRVHEITRFNYSDIGEYIDENHTDKPLRNDILVKLLNDLSDENEQLKQDRNALIHLLENQSMIIEELHSKLLEYQVKEPIVLTKEDLNLMGKAIGYYTHGRCGE